MARNFDGTDDNIAMGSDASIGSFATYTIMAWLDLQTPASNADAWAIKGYNDGAADVGWQMTSSTFSNFCEFLQKWTGTQGYWGLPKPANGVHHIAWTYDTGATTNIPVGYLDGVLQTITVGSTPVGTVVLDTGKALRLGESADGNGDYQGKIAHFVYAFGILNAAEVNRHRWWGRPHGGMAVYHPLVTDKLTNEGTGTADGTATGSTMTAMVCPVVRPGSAMMGMGIGW